MSNLKFNFKENKKNMQCNKNVTEAIPVLLWQQDKLICSYTLSHGRQTN
jgi:hypothetical protein